MSKKRSAARPPALPGYEFERVLGSGGFADVYLFTQEHPRRQVAVKALAHEAATETARRQFIAEANVMAQLSGHPAIVTIYHADTAADGRPYLVMQYCPLPSLGQRLTAKPLSVPEALSIGVRLAGAIETAHRAGIVHRDIKPANVLTTEYGRPVLADFGIAGLVAEVDSESSGVSVPWAPPEALEGSSNAGVRGDVYSLAATIYTALAGRSPFAVPGTRSSRLEYMMRIQRDPVPPLRRDDAPASLDALLARAMAKRPAGRPSGALELARSLQVIEQELRLPMTDVEVPDTSWLSRGDDVEEVAGDARTVIRGVTSLEAPDDDRRGERARTSAAPAPAEGAGSESAVTVQRSARQADPGEDTAPAVHPGHGAPDADGDLDTPGASRIRPGRWQVAVGAAVVVTAAVVATGQIMRDRTDPAPTATPTMIQTVNVPDRVPTPTGLRGERENDDTVVFTWSEPAGLGEVSYSWRRDDGPDQGVAEVIQEPPLEIESAERVCIELRILDANNRLSADPATACAD